MTIKQTKLKKLIEKSNLVTKSDLNNAYKISKHLNCSISDVLLGRDLLSEKEYGEILEKYFNVDFIDLKSLDIDSDVLNLIPEELAVERKVVAFSKKGKKVMVAMEDPKDLELAEHVRKAIGNKIKVVPFVATGIGIKDALKLYKEQRHLKRKEKVKILDTDDLSIVGFINKTIDEATNEESSDIHIEPLADRVLIRYRVDGVLHDYKVLEKSNHAAIVSRIKILSDLKLDENRLPQDGQFSHQTNRGEKISLRVSIIPTIYGEKVVLRILQITSTRFNLEELGILPEDQEVVERVLEKTYGMFLLTGPTGSGKTTTLYTALGLINRPDINIITIEDPVENKLNRVNQIQVNSDINLTFASGLRSILRQDPDVVMVGEIRDSETATISVNAAMTGHLVFSSVHANTSAGAVPRLLNLGAEPFLIASTLNMVIAQRLVRVLCPRCKKEEKIDDFLKERIDMIQDDVSADIKKTLKTNHQAVGCPACFNTGYRGRTGIFEILQIDRNVKKLIVNKSSSDEIWESARKSGAKTMLEDGLIKAAKGTTSMEEVFRVIS
jgi:type IV pilus assembly protein PilB